MCAGVHWCVQVYAGVRRCARVCAGVRRYAWKIVEYIFNSPQPQRRRILNPTFFFLSPTVFFNRKNFLINELLNGLPNDPEVQNGLMKFKMGQ